MNATEADAMLEPMTPKGPRVLESGTTRPEKPTEDMIQGIPPKEEQTKPAVASRTNLSAFIVIVLNAAALVFLGVVVDTTNLVDALMAAQWVQALTIVGGIAVMVFRNRATKLIRGVFRRP